MRSCTGLAAEQRRLATPRAATAVISGALRRSEAFKGSTRNVWNLSLRALLPHRLRKRAGPSTRLAAAMKDPRICAQTGEPGSAEKPLRRCGRCQCTWYADAEAQKAHWPLHARSCRLVDATETVPWYRSVP